jgi:hypothetical protein
MSCNLMASTQVAFQSSFRIESIKPKLSLINDSIDNNATLISILILKVENQMQNNSYHSVSLYMKVVPLI